MSLDTVALWGSDHTELGEIAVAEVPPAGALAISRGKFRKGYPYVDPNEDAVLVATDGTVWLLAVADGHNGFDAARAAIAAVEATCAETLAEAVTDPQAAVAGVIAVAHTRIVAAIQDRVQDRVQHRVQHPVPNRATDRVQDLVPDPDFDDSAATTLAVALLTGNLLTGDRVTVGSFGDSMIAVVRDARLRPVNHPSPFLDAAADPADVQISEARLYPGDVVLAATDGLTDFLGPNGPRVLARTLSSTEDPATLVRLAVEHAFAGGAGDNVAVAVVVAPGRAMA